MVSANCPDHNVGTTCKEGGFCEEKIGHDTEIAELLKELKSSVEQKESTLQNAGAF